VRDMELVDSFDFVIGAIISKYNKDFEEQIRIV
jgi:hypothetical protein